MLAAEGCAAQVVEINQQAKQEGLFSRTVIFLWIPVYGITSKKEKKVRIESVSSDDSNDGSCLQEFMMAVGRCLDPDTE